MFPSLTIVQDALKEYRLSPSKKMGQNFLIDCGMAEKIVGSLDICDSDTVIEIGPGLGALTTLIVPKAKKCVVIELDKGFVRYLNFQKEEHDWENLDIIHKDVLKVKFEELCVEAPIKLIGNLPYAITGPLLMLLIEWRTSLESAVIMLQDDVIEKLFAPVGSKDYNRLSVYFQALASVKRVSHVPSGCFHPRPKVGSAVVKIDFSEEQKSISNELWPVFHAIVKTSFQKRRKMITGSLKDIELIGKSVGSEDIRTWLKEADVSPTARPQELSVEDFKRVAQRVVLWMSTER